MDIEIALELVPTDQKPIFIKNLMEKLKSGVPTSKFKFIPRLLPLKEQIENWLSGLLMSVEKVEFGIDFRTIL